MHINLVSYSVHFAFCFFCVFFCFINPSFDSNSNEVFFFNTTVALLGSFLAALVPISVHAGVEQSNQNIVACGARGIVLDL